MTKSFKIVLAISLILILSVCVFFWFKKSNAPIKEPIAATTDTNIDNTINTATTTSVFKTYRNEEWGFEFQYPSSLILKEKVFGGYYSKFNLVLFKPINESRDWAVIINIVSPEFVDTDFWRSQKNTSKVIVDGVEGTRYEYEYEGSPQMDIVLPLDKLKILLGTGEGSYIYPNELNQIISSFKFLNK